MTDDTDALVGRLRRGAEYLEAEGDLGMPALLTAAADLITRLAAALARIAKVSTDMAIVDIARAALASRKVG